MPKDKKERVGLENERIKYWLGQGAKPTVRVARILGENSLMEMPKQGNNPNIHINIFDMPKSEIGIEWDVRGCDSFLPDQGKWSRLRPGEEIPK